MQEFGLGKRLEGRTAIITGGAGGIGSATAKMLAAHGANIIIADINEDAANKVVPVVESIGSKGRAVQHDVGSEESWKHVISEAAS